MMKTSVIVPVYNTAPYLKDCFNSIFHQTQKEIEVIAINDGSTDDSLSILEEIQKEHPEMILISQENRGPGDARNRGIELASGDYLYFLDSDDCIVNTAMEICYRYASENNLDIVMFDAETFGDIECERENYDRRKIITEHKKVLNGVNFANRYWRKAFYPTAWLMYFSARFLQEHNLRFLSRIYYEDNEFYCTCVPLAERIMYIPETLYKRHYRSDSVMVSSFDMRHAQDFLSMIKAVYKLERNQKTRAVMHETILRFLRNLTGRCKEGSLLENSLFAEDLLTTALHICGSTIDSIDDYSEIETLDLIVNSITDQEMIPPEVRGNIQEKRRDILRKLFSQIPLQLEDKCVGIYGTGKNAERFLSEYQRSVADIKAKIIPIDSYIKTGEKKYRGFDMVNINDITEMPLACIVITSLKYEDEIGDMIQEKCKDRFKVIRLSADLRF